MPQHKVYSDMAKVDAHDNTAADYADLPEITDEEFARAIHHRAGRPVEGRSPDADSREKSQEMKT